MSTTTKAETDKPALFGDSATDNAAAPTTTATTTTTTVEDTDLPAAAVDDNSDAGSEFNEEEAEDEDANALPLSTDETTTVPETPNVAPEILAADTPSTSVVKETPPPATPLSTSVVNETPPVDEANSNEQVVPLADSEIAMLNGEEPVLAAEPTPTVDAEEDQESVSYPTLPFFLNEETTFNYGDMCPVCFHAMKKEEMDDNMLANLLPCGHTLHVVCCDSLRKAMPAGNKTFNCPECSKPVAHAVTTTHTLGEQMEFKNQQGIVDSDDEEEEEEEEEGEEQGEEQGEGEGEEEEQGEEEKPLEVPVADEEVQVQEEIVSAKPKLRHTKKKKVAKPHHRRDKLFSKTHKKHAKNK